MGYVVYRWGFSCLDYSFNILISWSRKLGLYPLFYRVCFHRVLLHISGFMIIIIVFYMFTSCLTFCDLFHKLPALNILSYTCSYLISLTISLPAHVCLRSWHDFKCTFMIRIYRYTCACSCMPLRIHHTTRMGVSHSPGSSCPDPGAWSLWILPIADQSGAAEARIIGRPSEALSF